MASRPINVGRKLSRVREWIFPTFLVALMPIVAQWALSILNGKITFYNWSSLAGGISPRGELIIVAVALVAEATSEIWRRQIPRWQRDIILGICLFFVLFSSYVFSGLSITPANTQYVSVASVELFFYGIVLCLLCKVAGRS